MIRHGEKNLIKAMVYLNLGGDFGIYCTLLACIVRELWKINRRVISETMRSEYGMHVGLDDRSMDSRSPRFTRRNSCNP